MTKNKTIIPTTKKVKVLKKNNNNEMSKSNTLPKSSTIKIAESLSTKNKENKDKKVDNNNNNKGGEKVLNNKERKIQKKKLKLEKEGLLENNGNGGGMSGNSDLTGNLSNENILRSVIDSYILPLTSQNNEVTASLLDVKTNLPNVIVLLHQNQCLKKCLDNSTSNNSGNSGKSSESLKLRERWMELLGFLLKANNNHNLWVGIHLLCETVRVCDYDVMISKLEVWINTLTTLVENQKKIINSKGSQQNNNNNNNNITYKEYGSIIIVLSLLVEKASKWNDLKRTITNNTVMSPIVSSILISLDSTLCYPDECKINSLVALTSMISSVSTAMKPYLNKIETLVYPLLYNVNKAIQESTSSLISHLPQCVGVNSTDLYWDVTVQKLLIEMNIIIDKVFNFLEDEDNQLLSNSTNGSSSSSATTPPNRTINLPTNSKLLNVGGDDQVVSMLKNLSNVKFPDTPKEIHAQTGFYVKAFYGLSHCLLRILSTASTTPSPVPIDDIIKLICRVLNPNLNHLTFSHLIMSFSISQMIFIIQQLHQQAFILLSGILKIFRKSLLVHSKTISALLLRPLKSLNYSLMSPIIHAQIYTTISDVIESFGASSSESLAVQVLPTLLKDILPYIPEGSSMTTQNTTLSSSNRSTITSTIGNVDSTLQDFNSLTIKETALSALSSILLHCGSYLQPTNTNENANNNNGANSATSSGGSKKQICRLEIDQLLVSLLLECQSLSTIKKNSPVYLNSSYNCWRYRSKLYECLINCVLKPVSGIPPVIPYAIRIFTNGMNNDYTPNVRNICCKGVSICESIIHPQVPSLSTTQSVYSLSLNLNQSSVFKNQFGLQNDNQDDFEIDQQQNSEIESDDQDQDDHDEDDDLEAEIDDKIQFDENEDVDEDDQEEDSLDEEQEDEEEEEVESTTTTTSSSSSSNIVMKTSLFNTENIQKQVAAGTQKVTKIEPKKISITNTNDIKIDDDDENDLDLPDIED